MSELVLENVTLRFSGLTVLRNVSFTLERNELFALIGPNGAGKTSIFNCISGIYRPEGKIIFRGDSLAGKTPDDVAALGVARTFQHGELFLHMTALDNVLAARHTQFRVNVFSELLNLPAARRAEEAHRAAAMEILRFVEIAHLADTVVSAMPFGVQKIVGFARALASEPKLLLLDEPSAGLTGEERHDLAYYILKIKRQLGISILWIEHDMQMVADLSDRIHVLDYGRSLADGPPAVVLQNPDVIKAYLGSQAVARQDGV